MTTPARISMLRLALLLTAAGAAAWAAACGGGAGDSGRPATPALHAPRDVIAFGAEAAGGGYALYLVQPDGTGLRKLSDERAAVSFPRWSPAGDRIAYIVGGDGGPAALRLYDFATGAARTLSEQALPGDAFTLSWSPDAGRLAFIEDVAGGRLRVYDFEQDRLLDDAGLPAVAVDWSRSGERLAVIRPAQTSVYTVKPDGSPERFMLEGNALLSDPRWAPDGTLALSSAPSAQLSGRTLALYGPDGGDFRDLGAGLEPAWSADGRLAYSRPASAVAGADFDIYLVAPEAGATQRVTRATTRDRWPSWAPAGDALAYMAQAALETSFLCVVDLATGGQSCLELPGLQPSQADWSPF